MSGPGLIETFSNDVWTGRLVPVMNTKPTTGPLHEVSCSAVGHCVATGEYYPDSGTDEVSGSAYTAVQT